jgi:membrane protein required for colicin V production
MNLPFTFIDFLVVTVIIISAGYAAYRGLMSETLTIFSWAAAAFATLYFGPWLIPMARNAVTARWLAPAIAYGGVFLVVFIPLSFMSHRFSQGVKNSPIGPLDRGLGIAFGVVRGLVVVGLAYLAFTYFTPIRQQPSWLLSARTLPIMQSTAQVLLSVIPSQTPRDYITAAPSRSNDRLGDLIKRQNEEANEGPAADAQPRHATPKKAQKTYGATDRQALDRLFETTGGSGKQ